MSIREITENVVLEIIANGHSKTLSLLQLNYGLIVNNSEISEKKQRIANNLQETIQGIRECIETIQSDKFTVEQKNEAVEWIGW